MKTLLLDKTILITGATSGIGHAVTILCAKVGADVIATGRDEARLSKAYDEISKFKYPWSRADLTNDSDTEVLVDSIPVLDGLVFCAGKIHTAPAKFNSITAVTQLFEINTFSYINLIRKLLKKRKLKENASIIYISSVASLKPYKGNSLYSATKGAINSFSRIIALELAQKKIRVNCILPGIIRTKSHSNFSEEEMTAQEQKIPLGFGKTEDIANMCVFLLSDYARWITGTDIIVDGGQSIS